MLHDRPHHHLAQRRITYRRRRAVGDLFLGPYPALIAALSSRQSAGQLGAGAGWDAGCRPECAFRANSVPNGTSGDAGLGAVAGHPINAALVDFSIFQLHI
jgi:hypothetical protein